VNVLAVSGPADQPGFRREKDPFLTARGLIASPRPVPPYLRLGEPSACWNASEDDLLLVGGDTIARVGDREERNVGARFKSSCIIVQPACAGPTLSETASRAALN